MVVVNVDVPLITGGAKFVGAVKHGPPLGTNIALLVALVEPPAFVAVTTHVIFCPALPGCTM